MEKIMAIVLPVLAKLGLSLLTEKTFKRLMILGLEAWVTRTANTEDDKLLAIMKDAWKDV